MSNSYSTIKTALNLLFLNNPLTLIRGDPANTSFTDILQHSRDRINDIPVNLAGYEDGMIIFYDSVAGEWKCRHIKYLTVADLSAQEALAEKTDFWKGDFCKVENNGYGEVETFTFIYDVATAGYDWVSLGRYVEEKTG